MQSYGDCFSSIVKCALMSIGSVVGIFLRFQLLYFRRLITVNGLLRVHLGVGEVCCVAEVQKKRQAARLQTNTLHRQEGVTTRMVEVEVIYNMFHYLLVNYYLFAGKIISDNIE